MAQRSLLTLFALLGITALTIMVGRVLTGSIHYAVVATGTITLVGIAFFYLRLSGLRPSGGPNIQAIAVIIVTIVISVSMRTLWPVFGLVVLFTMPMPLAMLINQSNQQHNSIE